MPIILCTRCCKKIIGLFLNHVENSSLGYIKLFETLFNSFGILLCTFVSCNKIGQRLFVLQRQRGVNVIPKWYLAVRHYSECHMTAQVIPPNICRRDFLAISGNAALILLKIQTPHQDRCRMSSAEDSGLGVSIQIESFIGPSERDSKYLLASQGLSEPQQVINVK